MFYSPSEPYADEANVVNKDSPINSVKTPNETRMKFLRTDVPEQHSEITNSI